MEAGYVWDGKDARTENAVTRVPSLTVVARPELDASPDRGLVGGIARFALSPSKRRSEIDCAGGIVRFDFGS